jgi:hypothetical protein
LVTVLKVLRVTVGYGLPKILNLNKYTLPIPAWCLTRLIGVIKLDSNIVSTPEIKVLKVSTTAKLLFALTIFLVLINVACM